MDEELPLWIGCDMDITYDKAKKASDGSFLNSGTGTWTLYGPGLDSTEIVGTGTVTYVASSNGKYVGAVDKSVTILCLPKKKYTLGFEFEDGECEDTRRIVYLAQYRKTR